MKFRKKPIVIDAVRFDGSLEGAQQILAELGLDEEIGRFYTTTAGGHLEIRTLEGVMTASPGDYVIRGVAGEVYPCKPNIFEATYERVYDP